MNEIIHRATFDGSFTRFDSDMLFKLTDGTYWLQAEYEYWYHYAYYPESRDLSRRRNMLPQGRW